MLTKFSYKKPWSDGIKAKFFVKFMWYRVFSRDVTVAILVSQNNETAAMLESQTNYMGVELFSCAIKLHTRYWPGEWKRSIADSSPYRLKSARHHVYT